MIAEQSGAPCSMLLVHDKQLYYGSVMHQPTRTTFGATHLLTSRPSPTTTTSELTSLTCSYPSLPTSASQASYFLHTHAGCRLFCVPLLLLAFCVT